MKYRITMLRSWLERKDRQKGGKPLLPFQDAICGYEAALIACRLFISFLGLKVCHKPNLHLVEDRTYFDSGGASDEVKVKDLGGEWVTIRDDLTAPQADLLARTYNGASKASAHLTSGSNHGFSPDDLPEAIELVTGLLQSHLYNKLQGRKMERHFD